MTGSPVAQTAGPAVCGSSVVAGVSLRPQIGRSTLPNRQNKARMYMKTKEKYKKSLIGKRVGPEIFTPGALRRRERLFDLDPRCLCASVVQILAERSQNVYENKGK